MGACTSCHTGGSIPSVSFFVDGVAAASAHVKRGQTLKLVFAVTPPRPSQNWAGFKVVSPFSLSAGGGETMRLSSGEVQHTQPKTSGGSRNEFRFIALISDTEACGSARTLTGWGSAVDRDGSLHGDGSAMATLAVTVDCPPSLVSGLAPAGPALPAGPAVSLPELSEGAAAQVLRGWLQSSNYYRMPARYFAPRNGRLQDHDWVFDLALLNCATSEPIDVWRVNSATKQVTRQTAPGVFVKP